MKSTRLTVVLADGDFPRKGGEARRLLDSAAHVVCCDGAADAYRRRTRREPDAIVGDLDSLPKPLRRGDRSGPEGARSAALVRVPEQETNDLEKAVRWCRARGWRNLVVLGATGKREDHTIGNAFRALALGVEIVSDFGRFVPLCGRRTFRLAKGTPVSVFAPDPETRMVSEGLEWPLGGVRFDTLYRATLNRATASRVTLEADRPVLVWLRRSLRRQSWPDAFSFQDTI